MWKFFIIWAVAGLITWLIQALFSNVWDYKKIPLYLVLGPLPMIDIKLK